MNLEYHLFNLETAYESILFLIDKADPTEQDKLREWLD